MKKLVFLTLFLTTAIQSKGEIWFDVGIKGAYAPGVFTNAHVLDSKNQSLQYSHGYFFGGKVGINFGLTHSMTIDVLYSKTNQSMVNSTSTNEYTISLSSIDLPLMYRHHQENGGYGEIGPQFSFTQNASADHNGTSSDLKNNFNGSNLGVAAGFGQYIGGGDALGLNFGFRFAYMFGDIVASSSQNLQGDPVFQPLGIEETSNYSYKSSGRLYIGIALEANFNIGYIAKGAKCTKKTKFRLF